MSFNFIDLFSGAGGLSKGLEMAGLTSVLGIDNDKASIETYKANHKNSNVILGDIRLIDTNTILKTLGDKKIKLICGGPPCQGFSTVGTNNPNDHRNHLFLEFVRIVKALTPDYILVENVTGLLSRRNENTLNSILESFSNLGYSIDVKVLSAHHYGVPETRRRTIILGNRFGVKNIYPERKFKNSIKEVSQLSEPRTFRWAIENLLYYEAKKAHNHDISQALIKNDLERKRLSFIPEGKGVRYEVDQRQYLPRDLWFEVDWSTISENRFRQTKLKRLSFDQPAPTINTFKSTYYHPIEDRYLTPREAAAIQSFPADFIFHGSFSQQWRQIGNAVPPLLAKAIGEALIRQDSRKHFQNKTGKIEGIENVRGSAFNYKVDL